MEDTPDEDIDRVVGVNVNGYLYTLKYGLKAFRRRGGGTIIFVSSVGAIIPRHMMMAAPLVKTQVPYAMTKAANDYLPRIAAAWSTNDNVRTYGILPGAFETKMLQDIATDVMQANDTSQLSGFNPYVTTSVGDPVHIGQF